MSRVVIGLVFCIIVVGVVVAAAAYFRSPRSQRIMELLEMQELYLKKAADEAQFGNPDIARSYQAAAEDISEELRLTRRE